MFGRSGRGRHARRRAVPGHQPGHEPGHVAEAPEPAPRTGPFDGADAPDDGLPRLDLGSVRMPVPEGAQLQVEVDQSGPIRAVHLLTPIGQLTVTAFAAPRSAGLWSEVRHELVTRLEGEGARVREYAGEWGREVTALRPELTLLFIGINGPRWLLRGVAAGPPATAEQLAEQLRELLRQTVVVRGDEPMPAKAPLPLTLPEAMAEQLKQAAAGRRPEQP